VYACHFIANDRLDAKFLFQFAPQSGARLFPFLDFSAGKFPLQGHDLVPGALAREDFVVFQNEGSYDAFHKRASGYELRAGKFVRRFVRSS
jgi:hypothetical protein